jgi:ribosomal protein L7/L12
MSVTNANVVEFLSSLKVADAAKLIKEMDERWSGESAAAEQTESSDNK